MNLPELTDVLGESEILECKRTDRHFVELAILLYNHDMRLQKVSRVLGWIGLKWSVVAAWKWIQKFGQRLIEADRRSAVKLPAVVLMDETAIKQRGEEFALFVAVDPETRHLLYGSARRREAASQRAHFWVNSPSYTGERRRSW